MNREDEITAWLAAQVSTCGHDIPIGIGDDMAQIRLNPDTSVLITTDMLMDGVHFDLAQASLAQAGYKAMAASLSDCAAMATVPVCALVSVGLPAKFGETEMKELHKGLSSAADRFKCSLVGGDITAWNLPAAKLVINVAMLSKPGPRDPVQRKGARPGDTIYVTGSLGGSRKRKHLEFTPRVDEALKITQLAPVNSMIDITDGLLTDLQRICKAGFVGALLEGPQIPVSDDALDSPDPLKAALNDGEDFELLFTISPAKGAELLQKWDGPVPITRIGTIVASGSHMETMSGHRADDAGLGKIQMVTLDDRIIEVEPAGYDHLAKEDHHD